jgi:histone-lysine N-methyltransferase SETMAR
LKEQLFALNILIKKIFSNQHLKMSDQIPEETHIRHCMLFEFRKGIKATEATKNICGVYGDVLDVRKCQRWFNKFRSGDLDLSDDHRSGRPEVLDNDLLRAEVESDPRLTIQELADKLNATWSTVQNHLQQIGKVNRQGVWVPHQLSEDNKAQRRNICSSLITRHEREPFLHRIVTGDEKWVLYVNTTRKNQWLSRGQRPVPTARPGLHPRKVMLCVWWDIVGIIHFELLEPGQTITADLYCQQLDRLQQALIEKRPALVNRRGVILQHDNARPHSAKITQQKIRDLGWEVLPHPPYSPDIAPSDYDLFRSLQHFLSGKTFGDIDHVKTAMSEFFASKQASFYKQGIENLAQRWGIVLDNDGDYIID